MSPEQNNQQASMPQQAPTMQADAKDVEQNKVMGILAYIIFLVPLLSAKDSPFAKYHTNQGLILFLTGVVGNVIGGIIPIIGWFLILPAVWIGWLVLAIMGIINANNGEMKPLPIIGNYTLLK